MGANVRISVDAAEIDVVAVHAMLSRAYWSEDIPLAYVEKSIANSVCVGAYLPDGGQIGFARLVTDRVTFAYLCDVVVQDRWQGKGLGTRLIAALMELPWVAELRRIVLATRDAHRVYKPFGFAPLAAPQSFMEIVRPDIYRRSASSSF